LHCGNIGYKGRTAIAEILEVNDNMKQIINEGFPTPKVTKEVLDQKMITMQQNGFIKALKGLTTVEEVLRATKKDERLRVETKKAKDLPF
jgi:type IV pilus assembly protein PilB